MLSKCANPDCNAKLHYLREGKIFKVESQSRAGDPTTGKPERKVEYYWLCGDCCQRLTVAYGQSEGVKVMTKPAEHRRALGL
jgi:hypothetical protein